MVVIVRIDLDKYDLEQIEHFVVYGIVTLSEAREGAKVVRDMSEYDQVLWVRKMQDAKRKTQAARQAKAVKREQDRCVLRLR